MSHSFVMSQRVRGFPRLQNFSALLCVVLLHQCHLGDFFLFTNYLVVEVGEGCRQRECSWLGARECYWVFGVGIMCICVSACVCVTFLPQESLAAGVTCSNGKLCCTAQNLFLNGGHPLSMLPSLEKSTDSPFNKSCHFFFLFC